MTKVLPITRPYISRIRLLESIALGVVFGLPLVLLLALAPLDPDPHHDGYQFAVAVMIAEGGRPHVDVFDQYGPLTGELFGWILGLTEPTLLNLRVATAVLLALTCATGYVIARLINIGRISAVLIVLLWGALIPAAGVYSTELQLWPWPSVLFTLMAQTVVIFMLVAVKNPLSTRIWFAFGALLVVPVLIRINQGPPLVIALVISLLLHQQTRHTFLKRWKAWSTGALTGISLIFFYLVLRSDVSLFLQDAIIGPLSQYLIEAPEAASKVLTPIDLPQVLIGSFLVASLPFLAALWILVRVLGRKRSTFTAVVFASTTALVLTLIASVGYYGRIRSLVAEAIPRPDTASLNAVGSSPIYAAWLFVVVGLITVVLTWVKSRRIRLPAGSFLVLVTGAAFATQVFPRWDVYHLWWAGPVLLIAMFSVVMPRVPLPRRVVLVGALTIPYTIVALYSASNLLSQPRVGIEEGALAGMRVIPERQPAADALNLLSETVPARSAVILCDDGLLSAPGGTPLSYAANFVPWGWSQSRGHDDESAFIVVCTSLQSSDIPPDVGAAYSRVLGPLPMNLSPWSQDEVWVYQSATSVTP